MLILLHQFLNMTTLNKKKFVFTFIFSLFTLLTYAQQPLKVAVFAPVYIDSAFNRDTYKLGNGFLPKNILPGLDFYNGVMMAVDSLQAEGKPLEVLFYDSKSNESIYNIAHSPQFDSVAMIIACFNSRNEVKPLADIALNRNIPLISATYPNDGGVIANPYFVLINTSLKTHLEEIYRYVQRNHSTQNIIYFKRKGALEDMLMGIFNNMNRKTASLALKYKTVELSDDFSNELLATYLDSTKNNIAICGSLNEAFGIKLVKSLSSNKNYNATAIGMPTWDGLKELDRSDCNGVNLVYTTCYNYPKNAPLLASLSQRYKNKLNARPSDMFYKGYESMYHFSSLLVKNPTDVINHLSDKDFKIANEFVIEPLSSKTPNTMIDYLENKKIYFIKKLDGAYR